ncbi:pyridoxal phosphate-dependent aminotransferase family protein [Chryseobacterium sp. SSA4.19]|uniref:aminotransferase class I/II-fold pyridoxal phosphate-dependent enzyme n=1 Tax=Chryseobacterium sp. SSA4.19 TaxID=2919915 RepID=UPI001F4E957A|nr:pyridoxal phosphate-dependent aminotransferase family protein [Chryseobacterium sp. SSA4.19]MCJ8153407.1 pyridoxal phosphate-dependent aminotransferase family protein [Chryseobacterium sp. SSA4.19]
MPDLSHFDKALERRKHDGTLRNIEPQLNGVDFYSNDYLGLAKNREFHNILLGKIIKNPTLLSGSTGSRLISGNSDIVMEAELHIAKEHRFESALLFSSGYQANLALFSTLPTRHHTIIVDEQVHRSVHDGCRMSHAKKLKFRHNDCGHLEDILRRQNGPCYIAVESLYSMDGDLAPLQEIAGVAEKYNSGLIVDEAHAFGVFGYGLVDRLDLQEKVLAVTVTYGKALGVHGAAILSRNTMKSYLINFASPFIYTTASQDFLWESIKAGYDFLSRNSYLSAQLKDNIKVFRKLEIQTSSSENSPVQAVVIPDYARLKDLQQILSEKGFLTYAVFSPTVKKGAERLRICLHSFNTEEEITELAGIIKEFI